MAEEKAPSGGQGRREGPGQDPAEGPQTIETPRISIEAQYIKDLSFEHPKAPASLVQGDKRPDIKIGVEVRARPLSPNSYEVELMIKAEANREGEVLFLVDLTYGGLITVQNVKPEMLQPVLLIEGPRMLFPFARRVVSDVTRDGGFPPLMLNPIDFVELYRQNAMARARAAEAPSSALGPDGKPLLAT